MTMVVPAAQECLSFDASPSVSACPVPQAPLANALDPKAIRTLFPIFAEKPDVVFFDNASTTQKPASVIRTIEEYYTKACSNTGRASYRMSSQTAGAIEASRQAVASLLSARAQDIVFTGGATDSLNTVALSWGLANLNDGDEIMLCMQDHKSAVLPWINLKGILSSFGRQIKIVPFEIHDVGDYDLKTIRNGVSERTRLISMSHIHHVYGMDMEVPDIREIVGDNVLISLDASQSAGHIAIDLSQLPVDFVSLSGHKMFAGTGVGVLWVHPARQAELIATRVGGTGAFVSEPPTTSVSLQTLLEAGTPNIASILSMKPAVEFIEAVGIETIANRLSSLTLYLYEALKNLPGIDFGPGPGRCGCQGGYGIISFGIEGISVSDLGFMLDSEDILVRTGDHCIGKAGEQDQYVRVSMQVYNSEEEIDRLVETLEDSF